MTRPTCGATFRANDGEVFHCHEPPECEGPNGLHHIDYKKAAPKLLHWRECKECRGAGGGVINRLHAPGYLPEDVWSVWVDCPWCYGTGVDTFTQEDKYGLREEIEI